MNLRHAALLASASGTTDTGGRDWRDTARCRRMPEDQIDRTFFPVGEAALALALPVALTYCTGCPAWGPCFRLGIREADGIFAGMSPAARRTLVGGRIA